MILLIAPAALPWPRTRRHAAGITDALGRTIALKALQERIVVGFNFEEFTAVSGPAGWDRVVGFDRRQWENNRRASWARYQAAIPRLSTLADIGDTEQDTFSVERVLRTETRPADHAGGGLCQPCAPLDTAQVERRAGVPILRGRL